jgi:hypothetical protein
MTSSVLDVRSSVVSAAGDMAAKFSQFIPSSFVDALREQRIASDASRVGEMLSVAVIPVFVIEEWMAKGFNFYSPDVSAEDVVKRLKLEGRDYFLTTGRRI